MVQFDKLVCIAGYCIHFSLKEKYSIEDVLLQKFTLLSPYQNGTDMAKFKVTGQTRLRTFVFKDRWLSIVTLTFLTVSEYGTGVLHESKESGMENAVTVCSSILYSWLLYCHRLVRSLWLYIIGPSMDPVLSRDPKAGVMSELPRCEVAGIWYIRTHVCACLITYIWLAFANDHIQHIWLHVGERLP